MIIDFVITFQRESKSDQGETKAWMKAWMIPLSNSLKRMKLVQVKMSMNIKTSYHPMNQRIKAFKESEALILEIDQKL
jgi:hypothetical protein